MAKLLKLRRGTTSQHSSFTGAEGEVTVDTTKDTLVVHDGSTAGGTPLAKESGNIATATTATVGTNVTVTANNSTNETVYPVFVDGATGTQGIESDTGFTYNPSSGDLTIGGELDAATLDISGDADIDGTLEADAITVNGTALNTVIAGVTVTNATNCVTASSITVADESIDTICNILYTTAAAGNLAPKTGSNITFNSNTGLLSTTALTTTGNVIVGGTLQVDGTTTTVNSSTMTVTDKNIEIAKGAANDAAADGAGITVDSGDGDKTWNWVDATDSWTSNQNIHAGDNLKLKLGTGSDLTAYHDGSNSFIENTTGNIYIQNDSSSTSEEILIRPKAGEQSARFVADGAVELYHDNSKKLWTVSNGAEITGNLKLSDTSSTDTGRLNLGDDVDLSIYHNGTLSRLDNSTGNLVLRTKVSGSLVDTLILDTSSNATFVGTVSDSKGNVRSIPQLNKSASYTLIASDAGKHITTNSGITVNPNVLSVGDAVTIINASGSDITITQGSSQTIYNTADASTGNRTLAARGMATMLFTSAATCYISGAGLS